MLIIFVNNNPSSNKIINTLGNQVTLNLNPGISLDDNKKYQLRLLNMNCVYSMPNITTKNNTLKYIYMVVIHIQLCLIRVYILLMI